MTEQFKNSDIETMKIKKKLGEFKNIFLKKALEEIKESHPGRIPYSLMSAISHDLINNAVISITGRVYDKTEIEKWLEINKTDPITREFLTVDMLYSFKKLDKVINEYRTKVRSYTKKKENLLERALMASLTRDFKEIPEIFLCPVTKKLMSHPVISKSGIVYDESATLCEGTEPFIEFDEYLKLYCFNREKQLEVEKEKLSLSSPESLPSKTECFFSIVKKLGSFFYNSVKGEDPTDFSSHQIKR